MTERALLEQLAGLYGVEAGYHDIAGVWHRASDEGLRAVLRGLGAPAEQAPVGELVRARGLSMARQVLAPISVVWAGDPSLAVRLPADQAASRASRASLELTLEDGERRVLQESLGRARRARSWQVDGAEVVEVLLPLPEDLPVGYHRLCLDLGSAAGAGAGTGGGMGGGMGSGPGGSMSVDAGERRAESASAARPGAVSSALWVAPPRAAPGPHQPGFGVSVPLYALASSRNAGIGDLADLERLGRWVAELGGDTVATLPLLPTFLDGPYDPSPYAPVSRLFWNELYLALDLLPELRRVPRAAELAESAGYLATARELREARMVDHLGVLTHKRRILALLAEAAFADPAERAVLEASLVAAPWLADYARFRARVERERRPFRAWTDPPRERASGPDVDGGSFRYHVYCQVRAEQQMARTCQSLRQKGVGLYLDLPLGAHSDGYDAFRFGEQLMTGFSTGAPPDALFQGGQSWGFAPPHPEQASRREHSYFRAALRHQLRHATRLRLDHVMGLHRLFCIPSGGEARDGVYVRQPTDELYAALCIESQRAGAALVGEDLGTVADEVRARMARHGVARLFVMHYEPPPEDGEPLPVPAGAVASLNTHDMPTFAGYLAGRDLEVRRELGLLDAAGVERERASRAALREQTEHWLEAQGELERPATDESLLAAELTMLARSPASLVLVSLDDVLGELDPQNVPGTGVERGNWRRKLGATLDELTRSPEVHHLLGRLTRPHAPRSLTPGPDAAPSSDTPRFNGTSPTPHPRAPRSRPSQRLTELDLHLFNEGTHRDLHERLGAHPGRLDGETGTFFAVWAPAARAASVVGDFCGWIPGDAPLYARGSSGLWEGFVPGVHAGDLYKFHVVSRSGQGVDKADPMAFRAETPPRTASIVWQAHHEWRDIEWMQRRLASQRLDAPWSIYEVHLGSFCRAADGHLLGYRELAPLLADHVTRLGFTHVELLPLMEHPFYASWGYQTTGYFAATGRYGPPEDLMALVDALHQRGVGVLFDWVPGHFPTDAHGLGRFDGTALYEHDDPRLGFHPDWRSHIFNYGRHEVRSFLTSSALYWLTRFHADGLRVDGVASMLYLDYSRKPGEWLPNRYGGRENLDAIDFLRWLNQSAYARSEDIQMIAEESTAWPMVSRPTYLGGLGFGTKWDLGWMHDTLEYFRHDPIHRKYHHDRLTFRGVYAWHENFVLPLSHDEVVHGKGSLLAKMPGDEWQRFANLRVLLAYQWACPGHKLLFMGGELAAPGEWAHDHALDWSLLARPLHAGVARLVAELNRLYRSEPALHQLDQRPEGFSWVDVHNAEESVLAFERRPRDGSLVLCAFNFTPVPRRAYRLGVDRPGTWHEVLNSNASEFGGTGEGNFGAATAERVPAHGRPYSLVVTLPPLAALYFRSPG